MFEDLLIARTQEINSRSFIFHFIRAADETNQQLGELKINGDPVHALLQQFLQSSCCSWRLQMVTTGEWPPLKRLRFNVRLVNWPFAACTRQGRQKVDTASL
jgi:hypothetical protein